MIKNVDRMVQQLVLHEGLKTESYRDYNRLTKRHGDWTIGVGYNLSARGTHAFEDVIGRLLIPEFFENTETADSYKDLTVTQAEALKVCRADVVRIDKAIPLIWLQYNRLSEVRQRVALDMAFNMGMGANDFTQTKKHIEREEWELAGEQMMKSKWARQVDDGPGGRFGRADRLRKMLVTNEDYTE